MNAELLYDAITLIDDDLIEEAGTYAPQKRKIIHWKRWSALAACLVLVVCAGSAAWFGLFGGMGAANGESSLGANVGEGFDGGSTFMSYAGPVFPLTALEDTEGLTARRDITLDFLPWVKVWLSNEEEAASRTDLTEEERQIADTAIRLLEAESGQKVYISLEPFTAFYTAEEEHQDYYKKNPEAFRQELIDSGRLKV